MIKREEIERLPTALRDHIAAHLKKCAANAATDSSAAAMSYTMTIDEKHRSIALIAQGEYNAFLAMYAIFKQPDGIGDIHEKQD